MPANAIKKTTMKAVRIHSFGGPDVLQLEEIPKPKPKAQELLVRVHAAGVNPADWKIREGLLGKIPLPAIVGGDFSGEVEELGAEIRDYHVGEAVFGVVASGSGSYAEYAVAPVSQVIEKPPGLSQFEAAALPIASLTAWQALFDTAALQSGQRILIHAAAGGVGHFAVQFAKWKQAHVIGTASAENSEFVRQLGADEVIDYRKSKFDEIVRNADVVLDTIGGETQERSWKVLKRGGILVSTVQPPSPEAAATHGVRGAFLLSNQRRIDELASIAELVLSGRVKVHIHTILPLGDARKAQELSQSGHVIGKMVLRVGEA